LTQSPTCGVVDEVAQVTRPRRRSSTLSIPRLAGHGATGPSDSHLTAVTRSRRRSSTENSPGLASKAGLGPPNFHNAAERQNSQPLKQSRTAYCDGGGSDWLSQTPPDSAGSELQAVPRSRLTAPGQLKGGCGPPTREKTVEAKKPVPSKCSSGRSVSNTPAVAARDVAKATVRKSLSPGKSATSLHKAQIRSQRAGSERIVKRVEKKNAFGNLLFLPLDENQTGRQLAAYHRSLGLVPGGFTSFSGPPPKSHSEALLSPDNAGFFDEALFGVPIQRRSRGEFEEFPEEWESSRPSWPDDDEVEGSEFAEAKLEVDGGLDQMDSGAIAGSALHSARALRARSSPSFAASATRPTSLLATSGSQGPRKSQLTPRPPPG
ncbi:unnamed protein product, partial [Polarella glacialis]